MTIDSAIIEYIDKMPVSGKLLGLTLSSGWYLVVSFPVGGGWHETKWISLEKE